MSSSSFSTLASDRTESLDSLASPRDSSAPMLRSANNKTGSFVMCVSMATFYGGDEAGATEDDDFGLDNPFIKELGLDDKAKMTTRKNAIEEAAAEAKKKLLERGDSTSRKSNLQEAALSSRKSNLQEAMTATQFSPMAVRQEFMKRQDASTKAFTPAILQALAEKQDEPLEPIVVSSRPKPKQTLSRWATLKKLLFGPSDPEEARLRKRAQRKMADFNASKLEERAGW